MKKYTEDSDNAGRAKVRNYKSVPEGTFTYFGSLGFIDGTHDGMIEGLETWCKTTLLKAGFPTDPAVFYNPETGERLEGVQVGRKCTLIQLVSPGHTLPGRTLPSCHFDSREGFAARILMVLFKFQLLFDAGRIQDALMVHAGLWFLAGKAEDKLTLQTFRRIGSNKKRGPRWGPGFQQAIDNIVKEHRDWSVERIWKSLARYDEEEEVDGRTYRVYRDNILLRQLDCKTGRERSIEIGSLDRYVRRAKAKLAK